MTRLTSAVLVPTFNREALLEHCLESLLGQTRPFDQVIVIVDGSTDGTTESLKRYGDAIDVIHTSQLGKPAALNLGLRRVHSDCVWIFDDDDIAVPDAHERLIEPLEADANLGFSYAPFWYAASLEDGTIGRPDRTSPIPDITRRGFLSPLLESNFLGGAALFCRTSCYATVGDFDPELLRSQDYEMAIRIARSFRGAQARGGPTFYYRQHDGVRGPDADQFAVTRSKTRWLAYDQLFFRKLFLEISLDAYLPPSADLSTSERLARLQRATIMASKDLADEVLVDLAEVASGADQTPLRPAELELVEGRMLAGSWYTDGVLASPRFVRSLTRMAAHSPVASEILSIARRRSWREVIRSIPSPFRRRDARGGRPLMLQLQEFGRLAQRLVSLGIAR